MSDSQGLSERLANFRRTDAFRFVLLALIGLLPYVPIVAGSVPMASDGMFHYRIVTQTAEAQMHGDLYPRWMPQQGMGVGDPTLMYYPPLFHLTAAFISNLVGSAWRAIVLVLLSSTIATGAISYFYLRSLSTPGWAFAGAALMELNPLVLHYAFKSDAYPWASAHPIMLSILILVSLPRIRSAPLAFCMAALIGWHILSALMLFSAVSLVQLVRIAGAHSGNRFAEAARAAKIGIAMLVSLGLSAVYLVPALTMQTYIRRDEWRFAAGHSSVEGSFMLPVVGFSSGWGWFSYQWLFPALTLGTLCIVAAIYWRRRETSPAIVAGCLLVAVAAFALGTDISRPLWTFEILRTLQFPSRFNSVALMAALFAGALVCALRRSQLLWVATAAVPCAMTVFLAAHIAFSAPHHKFPKDLDNSSMFGSPAEYTPSVTSQSRIRAYVNSGGFRRDCRDHNASCRQVARSSNYQEFSIASATPQALPIPVSYYPAWQVSVNGRVIDAKPDRATGMIAVPILAGQNGVILRWQDLPPVKDGKALTLVTLLALIAVSIFRSPRKTSSQRRSALAP